MALPANCRLISRDERCILEHALTTHDSQDSHFAVYSKKFLRILGRDPAIELGFQDERPVVHRAGVYVPSHHQDAVFMTSKTLDGSSGKSTNIGKLTRNLSTQKWSYTEVGTDTAMGSMATNYTNPNEILFGDQGSPTRQGGLKVISTTPPYQTRTLISSYHARRLSSVTDVAVHSNGSIWFTDTAYGYELGPRPKGELPTQVYNFDPGTGNVRVVADGFGRLNGLCFSPDEGTVYVTDVRWIHGDVGRDLGRASSVFAFDMIDQHGAQSLANRRVFAMADTDILGGIECDSQGNVYLSCEDGVHVWTPGGELMGKIRIAGGVLNFCFGGRGELFLLNETKFWVVKISDSVRGASLANLSIDAQPHL